VEAGSVIMDVERNCQKGVVISPNWVYIPMVKGNAKILTDRC
jgi:hypothetical protein